MASKPAPKKAPPKATKPAARKKAVGAAVFAPKNVAASAKLQSAARIIDWERIELDYRAGIKTLRQIAEEHGITHGAVNKRAARDGWQRDLSVRAPSPPPVELATVDALERSGFVYVIYLQDTAGERFYKIGLASSFTARFDAHQCSSPFPICVACAYFVGNMRVEERELHRIFAIQRVRGEWFRLSPDDLRLIAERALLV